MTEAPRKPQQGTDWFRVARVRCGPEPCDPDERAGAHFAAELLPHCAHSLVVRLGEPARAALLRASLVRYLHTTNVLELCVVNEVTARLSRGAAPFALSREERAGALEIYCDEGYHAVLASALLARLGCDDAALAGPAFVARLEALERRPAARELGADLVRFLFVVVTETSISSNLRNLARNASVFPALREFAAEHARDEARHAGYFADLFAAYWARCSAVERASVDALLPSLVRAYLLPDLEAVRGDLCAVGLAARECETVLAESYPEHAVRAELFASSRQTLSCFRRAGVRYKDSNRGMLVSDGGRERGQDPDGG